MRSTCSRKYRSWSWWRRIGSPASRQLGVAARRAPAIWPVVRVLVRQRQQRDVQADHRAELRRPRTRRSDTTMSAGITPSAVATPVTRPPSCSMPMHRRCADGSVAPRLGRARRPAASTARDGLGQAVGRDVEAAEDAVARRAAGAAATHSSGVDEPALDAPRRRPSPACGAGRPAAPAVVATSSPPTWLKHHCPSSVEASELLDGVAWRTRSSSCDGLVWNTRPGACEVEPPVGEQRPWSTTVTSVQPRSVSSSARLVPTMPAR